MVFRTLYEDTGDCVFISPKEAYEKNVVFTIDEIYIKRNVSTKFGTADTAYVDIVIGGQPFVMSVVQTVLFKAFDGILNGKYPDIVWGVTKFRISKPEGKTYYTLEYENPN